MSSSPSEHRFASQDLTLQPERLETSFSQSLERHHAVFATLGQHQAQVSELANRCMVALNRGGKVIWAGNGGSAADAQHLAAEFMVRYSSERGPLASIALTTDTSILTAHSNDYDFATVFARQIYGLAKAEDVVIGLTTSGNSENINAAVQAANELGAYTVALTGRDGGRVKDLAQLPIVIASNETARIQEAHMFLGHWLCEAIDLACE
jgi:D-sedoheptulose 7-phosphate isomerase